MVQAVKTKAVKQKPASNSTTSTSITVCLKKKMRTATINMT